MAAETQCPGKRESLSHARPRPHSTYSEYPQGRQNGLPGLCFVRSVWNDSLCKRKIRGRLGICANRIPERRYEHLGHQNLKGKERHAAARRDQSAALQSPPYDKRYQRICAKVPQARDCSGTRRARFPIRCRTGFTASAVRTSNCQGSGAEGQRGWRARRNGLHYGLPACVLPA